MGVYLSMSLKSHQAMIDTDDDRKQALGVLALSFGFFLLARPETQFRGRRIIVHGLLL